MSTDPRDRVVVTPLGAIAAATFLPASDGVPVGTMIHWAGQEEAGPDPDRWLIAAGQHELKADYADLFAVVGTLWGTPADPAYFAIPSVRGEVIVSAGAPPSGLQVLPGDRGGTQNVVLTTDQMPAHRHLGTVTTGAGGTTGPTDGVPPHNSTPAAGQPWQTGLTGGASGTEGLATAHENMPPFVVMTAYIKARP